MPTPDIGPFLTHSGASGLLPDPRLRTKHKTITQVVYEAPPIATSVLLICRVPDAVTIVACSHIVDTGTLDFNVEIRLPATPDVAGTDIFAADDVAGTTISNVTSFSVSAVPTDSWLTIVASAASGTPLELWFSIEYTVNDA